MSWRRERSVRRSRLAAFGAGGQDSSLQQAMALKAVIDSAPNKAQAIKNGWRNYMYNWETALMMAEHYGVELE